MPERIPNFENPPGWTWLIAPMSAIHGAWSQQGVLGIASHDPQGAYQLTLAWQQAEGTRYRVVVFDVQGHRAEVESHLGAGSGMVFLAQFRVAPELMPAEQIVSVGVEMLPPDGWLVVSHEASTRARAANIDVLPLPRLHEPYQFTLTATDGTPIRSVDFLGAVVVVDCWATWCSPCMTKMPHLRALYDKWHTHGLTIIGINFDHDWTRAAQVVEELRLPWRQISVPPDQRVRDAWYEVSSIRGLPRLFVLDRAGTLRLDTSNPSEMQAMLRTMLDDPQLGGGQPSSE